MINRVAVCIFAYNRPEQTQEMLRYLEMSTSLNKVDVHIFSDGPKKGIASDRARVATVRAVIKNSALNIHTIKERRDNIGLRKSIIDGITSISKHYDAFLVLEDDIVIAPNAIEYAIYMLKEYDRDDEIMHINLWNHPSVVTNSAYLSNYMHCWGWASWSKYWHDVDFGLEKFRSVNLYHRFKITKVLSTLHLSHLYANFIGVRQTWAIFWLTHIILKGGKCISPPVSLSKNIGFHSGEHLELYEFDQQIIDIKTSSLLKHAKISYRSEITTWWKYITSTRVLSILNTIRIMIFK